LTNCLRATSTLSFLFNLKISSPPMSQHFPYTTLFRSPKDALGSRTLPPGVWASRKPGRAAKVLNDRASGRSLAGSPAPHRSKARSEEHTSQLQSRGHLVCRLLLEKKNTQFLIVQ